MNAFSSDVDLMKFEPNVFGSWFLSSQVLCGGTNGIVAGTQFTAAGVDFEAVGVGPGSVLWLESADESIKGAFEVVGLIDAGNLTVSLVRANNQQDPIPVGAASGLTWRIASFALQGYEVLWRLSQQLNLAPGSADADRSVDDILNPESLRQASVFGVLTMIFTALYQGLEGQGVLNEKAEYYQWQFDQALKRLRVHIDTNDDGNPDQTRRPDTIRLNRK